MEPAPDWGGTWRPDWGGTWWPGDHQGVSATVYAHFRGSYVAMFRDPAIRAVSAFIRAGDAPPGDPWRWGHGSDGTKDMLERSGNSSVQQEALLAYANRTRGWVTRSLAGQLTAPVNGTRAAMYETCEAWIPAQGNSRARAAAECEPTAPSALPIARRRLREGFKFVGITDHWALSICLLHSALGGMCLPVESVNNRETPTTGKLSTIEAAVQLRRAGFYDPYDDPLFADARRRFHADLRKHRVTPTSCFRLGCGPLPHEDLAELELAWYSHK